MIAILLCGSFFTFARANIVTSKLSTCDTSEYHSKTAGKESRRTILRDGDFTVQGIMPLSSTRDNCNTILQNGLVTMMALRFAVEHLQTSPFDNSSFGYRIDDSCNNIPSIMAVAIEIVNQYRNESVCSLRSCGGELKQVKPVIAVVGPIQSFTSIPFASLLGLYTIPIVSPSASSRLLSKKDLYKSFTRIIPSDVVQAKVIAEVLQRFNWNYIYVVGSDDNYGKLGASILKDYTEDYNFCVVGDDYIPYATSNMKKKAVEIVTSIAKNSNAKVIVIIAYNIQVELILLEAERRQLDRVWLLSDAFALTGEGSLNVTDRQIVGLFKVAPKSEPVNGFESFLLAEVKTKPHCNKFLKLFMQQEFRCVFSSASVFCPNMTADSIVKKFLEVNSNLIGNTIDAMSAVAAAVKEFYADRCKSTRYDENCTSNFSIDPQVLTRYLFNISFVNGNGETFEFDSNGDPKYPSYDLANVQRTNGRLRLVRVGSWDPRSGLNIDLSRIVWPHWTGNMTPKSTCSEDCPAGYYISARTECCWSCERCLLNFMSWTTNADNCTECPRGFVSNDQRTKCVKHNFVTLKARDVAGVAILVINSLGIIVSVFIFLGYRYYKRSAVVKMHTRMPHVLHLSAAQLILAFAYGEVLLMNRSHSYCSIVVGSMCMLRTGFAVLILSRTRIFLSLVQKFVASRTGLPLQLSHLAVSSVLIVIQLGLTVSCGVLEPVQTETHPLDNEMSFAVDCSFNYTVFQAVTFLVYPNLILLVTTVAAIRERSQRHAFSESKFLNFAAIANCILSVAFFPTYKYVVGIYKTIVMAFTMDVCAFTYIGCLMLPHLYIAYSDKIKVSTPTDEPSTDLSLAEVHRAKYRASLQEIKEDTEKEAAPKS